MAAGDVVSYRVQGQTCQGRRGEGLLGALRREGFEVPSLCHLEGLQPVGACRLCLVEVEHRGRRRLTTACNHPVLEDMDVYLDTEAVARHRRMVLELLLSLAPEAPGLLTLARRYGIERTRFGGRVQPDGCILCGLCARVCRQGARAEALALAGRGWHKRLEREPFGEFPDACIGCGACAWVCPTDAISMEATAVERLRDRWGQARPCRYALLGLAPGSICENDYACATCEVDQAMIERAGGRHPVMLLLEQEAEA